MSIHRVTYELSFVDKAGNDYTADLTLEVDVDNNYGADADGNRGMKTMDIINFEINEVYDEKGEIIHDYDTDVVASIERAVDNINAWDLEIEQEDF